MAIYLTSDLHFNHNREFIWKARGFTSVEEMNEAIVEKINAVVGPDDDLYLLGDSGLGGPDSLKKNKELIESLNGKIHIVRGNHDTDARITMYKSCKNVVEIADVIRFKYNKIHFYLSHYPTITSNLEKESIYQAEINLYGHTHQLTNFYYDLPFCYHVGVDSHNCYPVLLDTVIEEIKNEIEVCKSYL